MSTDIFTITAAALTTLGKPFGQDEYLVDGALPDQYITYFVIDGTPNQHADNEEKSREFRVQVNLYDRSGLADLPDVDAAMTAAGFSKGPERELPRDGETGHYCLAKDYFYYVTKE